MSDQQLNSLIKWLHTFELRAPHSSAEDISNGVALAEALSQIAPEWFHPAWNAKIKSDVGSNWRLKVSNLKKIVEAVTEYYVECLNQQLAGYVKPDAQKIGEHCDSHELKRLLQLVLGCAVNCNEKQYYITRIMGLEEAVQQVIMQSIQELENSVHAPRLSLGASLNFESFDVADGNQQRLLTELQAAIDARDQMAQRCHELDQQLCLIMEEKKTLQVENKKLEGRLDEFESPEDIGAPTSLKYSGLRKQVEAMKDEMFKLETSRDDYRLKVELLEKEISELQMKQMDLQKAADAANHLKDEVDALRETADKVAKYELTIESYKKKMEDFSDLRRQLKILEDKNTELLQHKIDYEEEVKRANLLKNHFELCKKQLAEVHHKLDEQTNKSEKLEFDAKKLEAQLGAVIRERDRLIIERDTLKETNEELKCTQLNVVENVTNLSTDEAVINTEIIPPAIKEKLIFLQHENKMLKLNQQKESEDKLPLKALLEESEEKLAYLKRQNSRDSRILELENKLEELQGSQSADSKSEQQKLSQLEDELRRVQLECERLSITSEERESSLQLQKQKVINLQESLSRKECELAALEERYKKYVEKAKSVIRILDPKQQHQQQQLQGSSAQSPSELAMPGRSQLDKLRKSSSDDMERSNKEQKLIHEMEEKLMISAFYHYGLTRHREAVDQRLAALSSGQGQSFLARQRQPTPRKLYTGYNSK
ncbi:protein Hook homolog 3 [Copidosoma floridanum]|uniref:protein Hook homolog 3 n=1 Tax=Copidosoma floridanum TaxID=29053 RepID=UPI0006C9D999|nr:protein Hook homolog 3 [Copidosoma floridanum]